MTLNALCGIFIVFLDSVYPTSIMNLKLNSYGCTAAAEILVSAMN